MYYKLVSIKFIRILSLFLIPAYLISCGTQKKIPPYYLDKLTDTSGKPEIKIPELRIQKNDLLSIVVYSISAQPETSDRPFNLPDQASQNDVRGGFLVDANGNIEYPQIGLIHVEGLTKLELAEQIKQKLNVVLTKPSVIIRFLNFKVTILGPVAREGLVNVPGERLTILEAIGLAGGVTDYGKKEKVKVIREIDGKRETGYVDLSSAKLFDSPYYNLLQNDVIIVEPTKQKARMVDQAVVSQRITLALGIITSAAFLYNILKN
jgi:polysaccharide biosynthesis/export protein